MKQKPIKKAASKKAPVIKAQPVNHIISKTEGAAMIARFEANKNSLGSIFFSKGREFDKSLFEKLLKLKDCKKIRIYNAVNNENEHTFVITAVTVIPGTKTKRSSSKDIYFKIKPAVKAKTKSGMMMRSAGADTEGVGNRGQQCPAYDDNNTAL